MLDDQFVSEKVPSADKNAIGDGSDPLDHESFMVSMSLMP
jgi:hypothetical protein